MENVSISTIKEIQILEAIKLLGKAYLHDPLHLAVFGKDNLLGNERFLSLALNNTGETFIAEAEGILVGLVRIVKYPQCIFSKTQQSQLKPELLSTSKLAIIQLRKWLSTWEKLHPRESHFHFGPIAVLPEFQRRGVGSMMMNHCCGIVDSEDEAGYLETAKLENVKFYRKFGFQVIGEESVIEVPNWFMKRLPMSHC